MRYRGVQVPRELVERVARLISEHSELGYGSVTEFVKDSVRRRVEQVLQVMRYEGLDRGSET